MVGVRIDGVVVMVVVPVIMPMVVMMMVVLLFQPAQPRAEGVTQRAIFHIAARRAGPLAFHVVVVAFLDGPNLPLKP